MRNDKHYDTIVFTRLRQLMEAGDAEGMVGYLEGRSHAEFRTAVYILEEQLLPLLPEDLFWQWFSLLAHYNGKAFVVSMTKALVAKIRKDEGAMMFRSEAMRELLVEWGADARYALDVHKFLVTLLPALQKVEDLSHILVLLGMQDAQRTPDYLVEAGTDAAYYLLFKLLQRREAERALLVRVSQQLVRKGDSRSFNLACIIKNYFDISVPGTFSLTLAPHQLSYVDRSYESFLKVLRF